LFVAATVGSDVKFAPRDVDVDHAVPFQCFHQRALSLPRTKTSMLFAPCEHTAGAPAIATPGARAWTFALLTCSALTLAALLTAVKSETSNVAAIAILISVSLWFIRFACLDVLA
jgi:hypothetical protein